MVRTTDEEVITRTLGDSGWHAVRHHKAVDDHWTTRSTAGIVPDPRIDFIDASNVGDADGILIRQQQVASVGFQAMPPKPAGAMAPAQVLQARSG